MKISLTTLGHSLAAARAERKVSLRDVERATGVPFSTLRRIEAGRPVLTTSAQAVLDWLEKN